MPFPPPAAGVAAVPAAVFVLAVLATGAAAGDGLTELFGLKKSASVFAGEGEGVGETAAVVFALRACFSAGDADAAAAGDGEVAAVVFFVLCVAAGEAAGEALLAAAGEVAVVASAFFFARCFAGEADGDASGEGD
jgi:hypothetical protein